LQNHGTHCAGIVAAVDNEIGVIGTAPKVGLYLLQLSGPWNSELKAAIEWCSDCGVQIVSISLYDFPYSSGVERACDEAYETK